MERAISQTSELRASVTKVAFIRGPGSVAVKLVEAFGVVPGMGLPVVSIGMGWGDADGGEFQNHSPTRHCE